MAWLWMIYDLVLMLFIPFAFAFAIYAVVRTAYELLREDFKRWKRH